MTLIVGGDSHIGAALAAEMRKRSHPVLTTSRRAGEGLPLDLADSPSSWRLPPCRSVVLCAAMTRLDDCNRNPDLARRINTDGVVELSRRLADSGAHLVFLSTNLVFDGSKDRPMSAEPTNPNSFYGSLKAEAEQGILSAACGRAAVLRLTKVLWAGQERLSAWGAALASGRTVEAFADVPIAPISLRRVVQGIMRILDGRLAGTYHMSASHDITWFDLARRLACAHGLEQELVQPSSAVNIGITPPMSSALGMGEAERKLGMGPDEPYRILAEEAA